ncbi:MAG: hypothetical protein ABI667_02420 [Sphingomicrobium sp.]
MTDDTLRTVRSLIGERIAELETRIPHLAPKAIRDRMDAIRAMAAENGLAALEGLADYGAHHALMPGHTQATRCCMDHMTVALDSDHAGDREAILASVAVRIH